MRSAYVLALLLCILGMPASGHAGASQGEVRGGPPGLADVWWATESFVHPDGRREEWEYVVAIEQEDGRLTISDGDGMRLTGTLAEGASELRGSYPWSDGTFGRYVLRLNASGSDCLQAAGSWASHQVNGDPVRGAYGRVSISFVRARLYIGWDSGVRGEPVASSRTDFFAARDLQTEGHPRRLRSSPRSW